MFLPGLETLQNGERIISVFCGSYIGACHSRGVNQGVDEIGKQRFNDDFFRKNTYEFEGCCCEDSTRDGRLDFEVSSGFDCDELMLVISGIIKIFIFMTEGG